MSNFFVAHFKNHVDMIISFLSFCLPIGRVSTFYLVVYNLASMVGWGMILAICGRHIMDGSLAVGLWVEVDLLLKVVQTAACLEVLHSMVGLVKSPWVTTFLQVFSRVFVVWAVLNVEEAAQTSVFTLLCITSWGLVEVPRYLFYAMNLLDMVPYPLFYLRYSLFAVLYPTGITGELGCVYMAAKGLIGDGTFVDMDTNSKILFAFLALVSLTYIPGSPKMYGHMVKTRKKQFQLRKEQQEKRQQ